MVRKLFNAEKYQELADESLHCSSLCGLNISPKLRSILMGLPKDYTISQLLDELNLEREDGIGCDLKLTKRQKFAVSDAYDTFQLLGQNLTTTGRPSSDKLAWIISDDCFHTNGKLRHNYIQSIDSEIRKFNGLPVDDWRSWLPWISLGIEVRLRSWRSPKITCLRRALFKLSTNYDESGSDANYPWEVGYSKNLASLPIPVLYQYESDKKTLDGISILLDIGLKQINHLRILHPDAISFAKDRRSPCKVLYRKFNQQQ